MDDLHGVVDKELLTITLGIDPLCPVIKRLVERVVNINEGGRLYQLVYPKIGDNVFESLHRLDSTSLLLFLLR